MTKTDLWQWGAPLPEGTTLEDQREPEMGVVFVLRPQPPRPPAQGHLPSPDYDATNTLTH